MRHLPLFALLCTAFLGATLATPHDYDPLARARETIGKVENLEAGVPPACYTKTGGVSNACWVCHAVGVSPNHLVDRALQEEYSFSEPALTNHWTNLFEDRTEAMARISDERVLEYVRTDNYEPLREALSDYDDYPGFIPDLDLEAGFDEEGFAVDGSDWRALRYKPFPGTFWPTNGAADDVFVRLPEKFRTQGGQPERSIYKINLSLLEASIAADPRTRNREELVRSVEPLDETVAGVDLDGDGQIGGVVTEIHGLPDSFVGDASDEPIVRYVHPAGVEYLHSVRYLDPDSPTLHAKRMKELRYSKKDRFLDSWAIQAAYEREGNDKEEGVLPSFPGSPFIGISGDFGWRLQGFIEDEVGRLRLQTAEEHAFCMGCHNQIGVTVDQTFTLARKVPGAGGWRYQDLAGLQDVPQVGHADPEILTYFERVRGGDEFRANRELIERFFDGEGNVRRAAVLEAAPGGERDLRYLVAPSRERALDLNRVSMLLAGEQRFERGRDPVLGPIENVHTEIENGDTELSEAGMVFRDGRLWLDWDWTSAAHAEHEE